jgi:putative peptide zinc metalloprotease protein
MTLDWYSALAHRLEEEERDKQSDEPSIPGIWELLEKRAQIAEYQPQRNPLVIERQLDDRSGAYYVLKNTEKKTYLRLSSVEHKLWQSMDGKTTVQELIVEHFMSTGEFAHGTVIRLVDLLYRKHMFTDKPVAVWSQVNQAITKGKWSYRLSLPAQKFMNQPIGYNGLDKYISWLYRYGGFLFFTRPVQVLLVLISVLGLAAYSQLISNPDFTFFGDNLLKSAALLWVASLLPVFIHELGHALTVKHFDREVPKGGVMLYFGMPAAFVDTTDIWLEPRRARLAVTWNGPYTGLNLGGAAAIFIYLFPTASINSLLFKMIGIAYVLVLFNVNPFLKFDGYHLLSDALEISSLRERSFAFLRRNFLNKFLGRKKFTREEKIFTVFGVLSLLWTVYALYLISSFYQTRIQTGLESLLGRNFSLSTRVLSFLLIAGLISFAFLMGLRLVKLVQSLLIRYSRTGGLQRHGQLAMIGSGLTVILAVVTLLALPGYAQWLGPALGLLASLYTAYRLFWATSPYLGSLRGVTYILLASSLCLAGLAQIGQLFHSGTTITLWLQWLSVILVIGGMILLVTPPKGRLGVIPLILGVLVGSGLLIGLEWLADFPIFPGVLTLALVTMISIWGISSLRGGARMPAFTLVGLGAMTICLSWFLEFPYVDLGVIGTLLLAAGGLHLVFSRLPQLSAYSLEEIPSETLRAIGASVAILVRRIIAQVFFESGHAGVHRLGGEFTTSMHKQGVDIQITGNKFQDNELPKRTVDELAEVYHLVFDELHDILQRELGRGMGALAFSYGIDLLPWQTREVVSELILSRLDWGLSLGEDVETGKNHRRELLKRVPLFVTVSDQELDNIANHLKQERFPAGEVVIREGEEGDIFYILERGKVSVWRIDERQVEQKIDELGPGQYFGEVALVSNAPRNATVRADTPLTALTLDYGDFNQCVRQYVNLSYQVNENVKYSWLLRGMPIFDELSSQDLDQLAAWLEPESVGAGEILFNEGDPGDKFYIVESGEVVISRMVDNQPVEISRREPGEYFGEIALLQDRPRTATITASVDTRLLSLKAEHFQELFSHFMQLGATISRTGSRRLTFVESAASRINQPQKT